VRTRFIVAGMTASSPGRTEEGTQSPERLTALSDGIYAIAMATKLAGMKRN
jgi:hypothetical protein